MPVLTTYPGVYIEEIPSGVRTITGVATSITAFIGRAKRGPIDTDNRNHKKIAERARYLGAMPLTDQLDYFCFMTNNPHRKSSTSLQGRCKDFTDYVTRRSNARVGFVLRRARVLDVSPGTPLSAISNSNWNSEPKHASPFVEELSRQ